MTNTPQPNPWSGFTRDPRSRELLRDQALKEVRDSMEKLVNAPAVEQILLTSYVMQ